MTDLAAWEQLSNHKHKHKVGRARLWVMGLVTLILNKPAMQSKNPKQPVTSDPHRKMRAEKSSWV